MSCYYAVSHLLKEKKKAGIAIQEIMAMIEHQSGLKACWLWSDNGSEFVNKKIEQFCWLNGIIHETTIPYLLEQNRVAEQAISIFFEMVCYILWSTGVKLWY